MLLERMAHIKQDSWHYKLVAFWHKFNQEKLEINNLWQYWFLDVPLLILMTLIFGAFGLFLVFGVGLILYTMGAALIDHPAQSLWDAFIFITSLVGATIVLLLVIAAITVLANWISTHSPEVEID